MSLSSSQVSSVGIREAVAELHVSAQVIEEKAAPTSEETTPIIFESVRASVVEEPAIIPTETPLPEVEIEPSSSTIVEDTQQTIIAAVPPTSETPVIQDESSAAEKEAARIAAKRAKVEAIHTQYEQDLSELVNAERALLTERLK